MYRQRIVMASDSRQTVSLQQADEPTATPIPVISYDYIYKTFLLSRQAVGTSTFGESLLGRMPTDFHIKTFEEESLTGKDDVEIVAEKLLTQLYQIFHLILQTNNQKYDILHFMRDKVERKIKALSIC